MVQLLHLHEDNMKMGGKEIYKPESERERQRESSELLKQNKNKQAGA